MNKRIIVCGIIIKDSKVLLGRKAKDRLAPYNDVWYTLGGGVENLQQAEKLLKEKKYDDPYFHEELKRELAEEANIKIENIQNICPKFRELPREDIAKGKDGNPALYIFLEFLCHTKDEAIAGDDIYEVKWVEKSELKNVKLTPPSQAMYAELGWI